MPDEREDEAPKDPTTPEAPEASEDPTPTEETGTNPPKPGIGP